MSVGMDSRRVTSGFGGELARRPRRWCCGNTADFVEERPDSTGQDAG